MVCNPDLGAVVVERQAGPLGLVTRVRLQTEMAGRLGYGRALHVRTRVQDLSATADALVLAAGTSLSVAGDAALGRERRRRYDEVVVAGEDGRLGIVSVAALFAELSHAHAHRAAHDPLTELANRRLLLERLAAPRDPGAPSDALLYLDLDDFKAVNDSLGHVAGDELLVAVARRLGAAFRGEDLVARLGGDEFAVLLSAGGRDAALVAAERVRRALAAPVLAGGRRLAVTASIGVAVREPGVAPDAFLRNADLAMYRAKDQGDGAPALYDPALHESAVARLELKTDLPRALHRGELRVVYQPVVALASGTIVAVEALLRWDHPGRGRVAPAEFVPVAEETGDIVAIGRWVLGEACRQVAAWEREVEGAPRLAVSVNVSPRQLQVPGFVAEVLGVLEVTGLTAERLVLELTEGVLLGEDDATRTAFAELERARVRIAIDDFGIGFSSLARLGGLPIGIMKIDKAFTATLADGAAPGLIRGLVGLADAMGVLSLAEGIERPEHVEQLRTLGCTLGQGFHLARPMPGAAVAHLLARAPAGLDAVAAPLRSPAASG
jgi:diguanylate cyclase (GGDEF)-like protein